MKAIDEHTKRLVELSEDYNKLFYAMLGYNCYVKCVINYFIEEETNYNELMQIANDLSTYFINLKSLDCLSLTSKIKVYSERLKKVILSEFDTICTISEKYNINNIDELLDQIVELWNKKHINNDTFKRNVIRTLSSFTKDSEVREFARKSFGQVYLDMVDDDILDPMQPIGTSSEPLYIKMPVSPEFYDANFKVLSHKINWQLLSNGGVPIQYFFEDGYYFDVLKDALMRDCCVFDNMFQWYRNSEPKEHQYTAYTYLMWRITEEEIKKFKEYLTIPEVFNHQLELYKGHENPIGDAEIAELKPLVDSQKAKTY